MGRMMEALKGGELKQVLPVGASPETGSAVETSPPAPELRLVAEEPETEPMPFIEVGGPGQSLQASADVLAIPVRTPTKPTPPVMPAAISLTPPPAAPTIQGSVTFQPWPRGETPTHLLAPELLAHHQPDHPLAQQYRALFEQLPELVETGRVLLFTAIRPGSGTTTALLNLAITACRQHKSRRLAVVDLHWQRPTLAERLGLVAVPGLREVLDGSIALEQALQTTVVPGLIALTAGLAPRSFTTSTVEALRWVLGCLRERHDLVLLDGPVWDDRPELALLLPVCDAVYPVVREGDREQPHFTRTCQAIIRRGGRLRGVIQTQQ